MPIPSRSAALEALYNFLPRAGQDYAEGRNTDPGPDAPSAVSWLSPWVRTRTLSEWEIVGRVLRLHDSSAAAKFIDEICWRTYWKGWLALRPGIWQQYLTERADALVRSVQDKTYHQAITGASGICCFDAWTRQLIETGYLHNHARMWFASIWIHTLRLPWVLGADFFLRHLLDGDAASNTLSWRWVAGLHTKNKAYLATAQNIHKFTNGRFSVTAKLADKPAPLAFEDPPAPQTLRQFAQEQLNGKTIHLLTEDDLSAGRWLLYPDGVESVATLFPRSAYEALAIAPRVQAFRQALMADCQPDASFTEVRHFVKWAQAHSIENVVMAEPAVGLWNTPLAELIGALAGAGIQLVRTRHWWDLHLYPAANRGFFHFKKAIPGALARLD